MSWVELTSELSERLTGLLWAQWQSLGVGHVQAEGASAVIDPEAMLLLTWSVGRTDPRLFDVVLQWCSQHGSSIDVKRLKALSNRFDPETWEVAPAWARCVLRGHHRSWKSLLTRRSSSGAHKPLFLEPTGEPAPTFGEPDGIFAEQGWLRGKLGPEQIQLLPPVHDGPGVRLFLRSLFGTGARAEIIAVLLLRGESDTAELARVTGYGSRAIQLVLHDLLEAHLILWERRPGQRNRIQFQRGPWMRFLRTAPFAPSPSSVALPAVRWFDVASVYGSLDRAWRILVGASNRDISELARQSLLRDAGEALVSAMGHLELADATRWASRLSTDLVSLAEIQTLVQSVIDEIAR